MPHSVRIILKKALHKGAITPSEYEKVMRNIIKVRCKDCKNLSEDRIAPEWNRICRKYGVGKSDDGFCDEAERKETEDEET